MDNYASGGVGAVIVLMLGLLYRAYQMINHKRIRSNCCGKIFSASIDIDPTDMPVRTTPKIEAPLENNEIK